MRKLITVYQKYLEITNAVLLDIYYKVLYRERKGEAFYYLRLTFHATVVP